MFSGDSRKFALEKYIPLTFNENFTGTHIYWEKDTVVFDRQLKIIPHIAESFIAGPKYSQLFDYCTSFVIHSLQSLFPLPRFGEFLERFKNLRRVYILNDEPGKGEGNMFFHFSDQDDSPKISYTYFSEEDRRRIAVEMVYVDVFRGCEKRLKGLRKQEKWDNYLEGRRAAAVFENVCKAEEQPANTEMITVVKGPGI